MRTIYLETSNYRQTSAILRPVATGSLIEAAHATGLEVIAWYLPSFRNISRDRARSLAAIRFRMSGGQAFDGFARHRGARGRLGIAANHPLARPRMIRNAAPNGYALGAIIPSPRGMQLSPTYWPGFPYRELGAVYDVMLPMSYFTYRVEGMGAVRAFTAKSITIIRQETGRSEPHDRRRRRCTSSAAEAAGFMAAIARRRPLGYSLYDYFTTSGPAWTKLANVPAVSGACR